MQIATRAVTIPCGQNIQLLEYYWQLKDDEFYCDQTQQQLRSHTGHKTIQAMDYIGLNRPAEQLIRNYEGNLYSIVTSHMLCPMATTNCGGHI